MANESRTCPPCGGNCGQGRACPAHDARAHLTEPEGDALSAAKGVCLALVLGLACWSVLAAVVIALRVTA